MDKRMRSIVALIGFASAACLLVLGIQVMSDTSVEVWSSLNSLPLGFFRSHLPLVLTRVALERGCSGWDRSGYLFCTWGPACESRLICPADGISSTLNIRVRRRYACAAY